MEWKSVEPNVWKPEKDGDCVEGVLIRMMPKDSNLLSARYWIENSSKDVVLVWGSTVLDDRMSIVPVGSIVRITYKGKQKNSKKQDVKIFKVEVANGLSE